jgi:IS1 family transposase/lambda repressor-like predicted transcriptional regulator
MKKQIMLDAKHKSSDCSRMNKLTAEKRAQILNLLCEGSSMRAISRVADVSLNTVTKLLVDAGNACAKFHDETVRNVRAHNVQADEIWSFCYAKDKTLPTAKAAPEGAGSVWTWTALDRDSKLIISYLVGGRDAGYAMEFMEDLRSRLSNRVQLSSDGHSAYPSAVETVFGAQIDYAQLVKVFGPAPDGPNTRYSPAPCIGIHKAVVSGHPALDQVSTSHVERSNLSFRMHMRRFTRLTNAHSKKFENHCHMIAIYTVWYNFVRINSAVRMAPAMAAGLSSRLCEMADIVKLIDDAAPVAAKRGPYKKRISN